MVRAKHPEDRKTLLCIGKKCHKAVTEFASLRGDSAALSESLDCFKDADATLKLMKKKKAAFFVSSTDEKTLVLGRAYDSQFLELVKFNVKSMRGSADFPSVAPELYVKYFVLLQGITNPRLENMLVDLFHQRTRAVCLQGIRYAWVIAQVGGVYTLKFVRVLTDHSIEDVGPFFEMTVASEFYCGDDLWKEALGPQKAKKKVKTEKTATKDVIGKIHLDRQDLSEIQLKKSRGYKHKRAEV
ncbi:ribosome production factor 2 [Pancytospora philotis]|nr:ribosome production factor 2 [Pancytospora philotis]